MLKTCLAFWKSEPQYAYKRYAYEKNVVQRQILIILSKLEVTIFPVIGVFSRKKLPLIFSEKYISSYEELSILIVQLDDLPK